jgi:hypothetical protein
MDDNYRTQDRNEVIFTRRAGVGLFWAIASMFAPLLVLLTPNLSSFFKTQLNFDFPVSAMVAVLIVIFITLWGSSIVKCVWEMIKHHALLSGLGLFLLVIQPAIWFFLTPLILLSSITL